MQHGKYLHEQHDNTSLQESQLKGLLVCVTTAGVSWGAAKSPQATGEPHLSISLQSDSHPFYEIKSYLLCASLIKEIQPTAP